MKFIRSFQILAITASLASLLACNSDSGVQLNTPAPAPGGGEGSQASSNGPINGSWTIGSWTCGQFNLIQLYAIRGLQTFQLNIANSQASSAATFNSGCTETVNLAVTYPTGYVDVQQTTTSCSSGCSNSECKAAATSPTSSVRNYNYALTGNTLTLTRIIPASDAGHGTYTICATGDSETINLTK